MLVVLVVLLPFVVQRMLAVAVVDFGLGLVRCHYQIRHCQPDYLLTTQQCLDAKNCNVLRTSTHHDSATNVGKAPVPLEEDGGKDNLCVGIRLSLSIQRNQSLLALGVPEVRLLCP